MIGWLAAFAVLIGIEAATMALTTIWFAGGAVAAFFAAALGGSIRVQLAVFLIASFVLLIFTRPFAARFVNRDAEATNAMGLIGKKAKITARVDNEAASGTAVVNGQEWTARAYTDGSVIEPGETVVIREICGVKLMVEKVREEK